MLFKSKCEKGIRHSSLKQQACERHDVFFQQRLGREYALIHSAIYLTTGL